MTPLSAQTSEQFVPTIKRLQKGDIPHIVQAFAQQNWPKPSSTFERYLLEQNNLERLSWVAFLGKECVGYITLKWKSSYEPFRANNIPEIMDLNVLPPYRRRGIGSTLLDIAEREAAKKSPLVGLGVGLYADYGSAQRLYYDRGYVPNGLGVTYNYIPVAPGAPTIVDDDLVFWLTKETTSYSCSQPDLTQKGFFRPYASTPKDKKSFLKRPTAVDLTHTLSPTIPSWDGDCGFSTTILQDYADINFRIQHLGLDAGIGTHVDAPSHRHQGGRTIEALSLEELISPCVVIDLSTKAHERYSVSPQDIVEFEQRYGLIPPASFVIVRTGWDRFWDTPDKYRNNLVFPSISLEAIQLLIQRDICGIGIDTLSPDRPEDGFCVHKALLGANKYIVENVANAHLVPPVGSYSFCLPMKVGGGTEAPVRLISFFDHQIAF